MTTKHFNNQPISGEPEELSYYFLTLQSYLQEIHSEKASDHAFIRDRADRATEEYADCIRCGLTHIEAEEFACEVLYEGFISDNEELDDGKEVYHGL
jgi:hypothetical protein